MAKATKKTSAKKETKQASAASSPLIDTNMAAEAAAKMIMSRVSSGNATQGAKESSGFKNMKEGLSKPHLAGMNSVLNQGGAMEGKKVGGGPVKQVGHNQTFGSDSSRAFVPRRTGG